MNSGTPMGIRDGEARNAPAPASPDGDEFLAIKPPWGLKLTHLHPLIDEFPTGDRGSGPIAIHNCVPGSWEVGPDS